MKDRNGTEIEIGDRVAYNRSGDVVDGVVVKFGLRLQRGYHQVQGIVWRNFTHTFVINRRDGKTSKVMKPRTLLVISKAGSNTETATETAAARRSPPQPC